MSELEEVIRKIVDERVKKAIETQVPEMIRSLTIRPVEESDELIDATEAARLLGYDVSTPVKERRARNKVYDLVSRNLLPSVRLSPRRIRFDPAKVREVIDKGGIAEPYTQQVA
jgi:hypothetical protein